MLTLQVEVSSGDVPNLDNSNCGYQQLCRIVDIDNSNCWYQQFELSISTIIRNADISICRHPPFELLKSTIQIADLSISNCGYQQLWIKVSSACHRTLLTQTESYESVVCNCRCITVNRTGITGRRRRCLCAVHYISISTFITQRALRANPMPLVRSPPAIPTKQQLTQHLSLSPSLCLSVCPPLQPASGDQPHHRETRHGAMVCFIWFRTGVVLYSVMLLLRLLHASLAECTT